MKLAPALLALSFVAAAPTMAETIDFDFAGNGGIGLLPENEVGANTSIGSDSLAFGGELATGLVLDTDANTFSFDFAFAGLTGGLADVASGIHLHVVEPGSDIFNTTGPIAFNLNTFDTNVDLSSEFIEFGSESGRVTGVLTFTEDQEAAFLAGEFYLNIHSEGFTGGELRGSVIPSGGVVAVPTPAAATAGLAMLVGLMGRRRQG